MLISLCQTRLNRFFFTNPLRLLCSMKSGPPCRTHTVYKDETGFDLSSHCYIIYIRSVVYNDNKEKRPGTSELSITNKTGNFRSVNYKKKIGNFSAVDCKQDSKLSICQLQNKTGNFRIGSSKKTGYFRTVIEFINYSLPKKIK